ncbi:hypothetical protein M436DRAFT_77071 [Aureobasidium namibiae CBS 147.97]|uniref:Transcription factor domain-containing protein n=1 Tax=Aureobasidium namibiae CBS 147.97 TaxID=1043004 RepID=A0A074W517_9PEZI|nr:uncharacterized protein M436DRAFT_77071 [Aureobasidium namibiae CBS 147.97]KEQ68220.1 hypothetical protein M436DRAFT_77071 [Aureobasidium namibiae CBS 147.97]
MRQKSLSTKEERAKTRHLKFTQAPQSLAKIRILLFSLGSSPDSELMNPLTLGVSTFAPKARSIPLYLETSSNWSFGRRVLTMAHEQILGEPLSPKDLLFQCEAYDLGWDGLRGSAPMLKTDSITLPTAEHAMYLINATKFYVGQTFHLFDEESFMMSFARFHNPNADKSGLMPLWYVHYLPILVFGKTFLARTVKGRKPPGADLFVQAMVFLPDVIFLCLHHIETIEILCCVTLYLHSLDFRSPAYQLIGQALRIALEHCMHTNMQSQHVTEALAQRCRKFWWTVHVLDRNLSSLMSASLPLYPEPPCRATALDIQVKLSRLRTRISNALLNIARITDQLHRCFEITPEKFDFGISRLSAYLHVLHHQCAILVTRPLLYTFLETRLHSRHVGQRRYNGVKALLIMCIDSAFQNIRILSQLQDEALLECFLSFDLDATFSSALVLLMAAVIVPSLPKGNNRPAEKAYQILGEMTTRGNSVAGFMLAELRQLETILGQIHPLEDRRTSKTDSCQPTQRHSDRYVPSMSSDGLMPRCMDCTIGDADWQYTITTEQMIQVADSLDFEAFGWTDLQ